MLFMRDTSVEYWRAVLVQNYAKKEQGVLGNSFLRTLFPCNWAGGGEIEFPNYEVF